MLTHIGKKGLQKTFAMSDSVSYNLKAADEVKQIIVI
jgi:hypothetical protein